MASASMKHMDLNFFKLGKFEGVDFRRWQKKMHFLLSSMSVVYVLTTSIPEDGENAIVEQLRKRVKWDNDDYVCRELWDSFEAKYMAEDASSKKFLHTLKHQKEELTLVEFDSHLCIEESLKMQDSDKLKGKNVVGPSVINMMEHNNPFRYNDNKGKRKYQDTKADPNKKSKVTYWKYGNPGHLKKYCKGGKVGNKDNGSGTNAFMSTSKLNDSFLWHARLGHVHFKRMQDMSKDALIPVLTWTLKSYKKYFATFIDDASRFFYVYLLHTKDEALDKFKVFKTKVELQQGSLIKRFRIDRGGEYMDTLYFQSVGIIHETTAPYTPQQNGISERKIKGFNKRTVVRLLDPKLKTLGERCIECILDPKLKTLGKRCIECIFVGYAEQSKAFRFSSVTRPSLRFPNGTEDIGGSVVPEEVTKEVVQQPELELRKSKRNKTPKNFRPKF
ncbi:zinc finger, CCHC-type containing protein [Tanacetum coccineum]